jgi:NADPH:quinone reductase-like Zn-dependent oxidoreductase
MKAIIQDRFGSPDVLHLEDVQRPEPGDGEVLVRVHAASVNALDWHVMRGDPYIARLSADFGRRAPKARTRGVDIAGRVEAVGAAVTRFCPGDEVFGGAPGAFAEYACTPESRIERKPANLTFEQAAAIPMAANTALTGLRDVGRVHSGQRLLINGASGGVGTFAVQLAKAYGAEVTAVCRTGNMDLVRSLGADHVVDYTRDDFTRAGARYDVVLDLVGNRSITDLRRALVPNGTLILSGGGVSRGGSLVGPMGLMFRGMALSRFVRHRIVMFTARLNEDNLATLRELAESGTITPIIDRTYPLAQTPDAIRYLETEHARAKVTITVKPSTPA